MMLIASLFFLCLFVVQVKVQVMYKCDPNHHCLTCSGVPYNCATCRKGYYFARGGAYFTCKACPSECAECDHYSLCTACHKENRYGSDCKSVLCSKGCLNSTCDQKSGTCLCRENYEGGHCDYCAKGKYGIDMDCLKNCPDNCIICVTDTNCTKCKDGYYGNACDLSCSRGCYQGKCSKINGTCFQNRCNPNFDGINCDQCFPGRYGNDCRSSCPENCVSCSSETKCNLCKYGFWGDTCQYNCSYGCLGGVCLKQTGICQDKCRSGFIGDKCDRCVFGNHGLNCSSMNETVFGENSSSSTINFQVCVIVYAVIMQLLCSSVS